MSEHEWLPVIDFVEVETFEDGCPIRRQEMRTLFQLCPDCGTTRPVPTE